MFLSFDGASIDIYRKMV